MSGGPDAVKKITQFSRQAHYLSERENPYYSSTFKATMRYVPLAMRLYRAYHYYLMECDFAGFSTTDGKSIRDDLKVTNEAYVKKMAPRKYWDALIPKYNIGCKRKVLDTEYLSSLHRSNVSLVPNDPVQTITSTGVVTQSGRAIRADAIVLAIGFATTRMLSPMEIRGRDGITLNEHWDRVTQGAPQAYFGTCVSDFPNFFILMGPNTVTGHLSVIYTVECQINFLLRLVDPIVKGLPAYRAKSWIPAALSASPPTSVVVTQPAFAADSAWTQREAAKLVWSSGCTSWAIDPKTNFNIMMYPDWQFWYWWRSVFFPRNDFIYRSKGGKEVKVRGTLEQAIGTVGSLGALMVVGLWWTGMTERSALEKVVKGGVGEIRGLVAVASNYFHV